MTDSTRQWIQIAIQAAAPLIVGSVALRAWRTSVEALHSAYRPVLRPVPVRAQGNHGHQMRLLLKNIGRGPAVAVMMFAQRSKQDLVLMAELDLVEPLGPRAGGLDGEAQRVGRRLIELDRGEWLDSDRTYRLLYQDIAGRWHETRLRLTATNDFTIRYLGPKRWWQRGRAIPNEAKSRGQVTTSSEGE